MTPEPDASPSSTPMAPLKLWQDHVRLGSLIIQELGNENRNGVLGRWMALRVAELLRRAEGTADPVAKEAVERECQDLIIRLWESRESWPSGGPLGSILPTLKVLLAGDPDYRSWRSQFKESKTIGLITSLLQLQRRELQLFCLTIHDQIPASTMEAMSLLLAEHQNDLSEEEANVLYFITNPSRLPFFNHMEVEVDEDEPQEETKLAYTTEPVDRLAEFLAFITKERQQFFAQIPSPPSV